MDIQEANAAAERRVLIGCITHTNFLKRLSGKSLGDSPFRSSWSNLIFGWCLDYFQKYGKAPRRKIEYLLERWASKSTDKDTAELVNRFLGSLNREYIKLSKEIETDFAVDQAELYFNEVRLEKVRDEIDRRVQRGQVQAAIQAHRAFVPVQLKGADYIDVLGDRKAQKRAFSSQQEALIDYPGPAGKFFGTEFGKDAFVGVMASSKGGKSYFMLDAAWRAIRQGRRVAYFQVGDLSETQIMRRFMRRANFRPFAPKIMKIPTSITLPIAGERGNTIARIETKDRVFEDGMTWEEAQRGMIRAKKKYGDNLRLICYPVGVPTVPDIQNCLDSLDQQGWVAEVVIIDYAGNLAPTDMKENPVQQTSRNWALMRQLSQVRGCLVVTANQSNKEGFRAYVLTRSNFADSKMILAHVTAFIGINRTNEEQAQQIMRYNFVARREEQFNETYCLHCAGCLDAANPIVVSTLPEW